MAETIHFASIIALVAAVGLIAVLSNRLTERLKIPVPALVLVASALAVKIIPALHPPGATTVERIVTVALIFILFDGGMHIGWSRLRTAAAPIAIVGVLGTFLTTFGGALLLHWAFGLGWYPSLLVATAIAPTDPAVVFSVLGRREIDGRSSTILEGESGANDPVGIALMASLISAGGLSGSAFARVGGEFVLQMAVGAAVGAVGGWALLQFVRRVSLPSEGLYPLRTLASVLLIYGLAAVAHGSGFLAVFVAGILVGDAQVPYRREVRRFHAALAGLAEIVAFVVLGLTVDLGELIKSNVLVPGLVVGIVLAFVIRPLFVSLCLLPARLARNERHFVLFAGLKGAVPILLGGLVRHAHLPESERLYGIVVVVVIFSVVVQGGLTPTLARRWRLPMRMVDPKPWSVGLRLDEEPRSALTLTVEPGSAADGQRVADVAPLAWVSLVTRDGHLLPLTSDTLLRAGDDVLAVLDRSDAERAAELRRQFEG
jgi:potassium/hydrogen antiporter